MEKYYKNLSLFFIGILSIVILGFFKTYFGQFPTFNKVTNIQHIHGLLFLLWFIMLVIQPILIKKRKYRWHVIIGKVSYFLVPLIVISTFFIAKELYDKGNALDESKRFSSLYVPFYQIIDFIVLYLLAIYYKKKISYHMRYMIATSLAIYGAALKRLLINYMNMGAIDAFFYTFIITDLILLFLIVYDWRNGKSFKPYVVSLLILLLSQLGFFFLRNTSLWQHVFGKFVHLFW
jgi:hypothetical protein